MFCVFVVSKRNSMIYGLICFKSFIKMKQKYRLNSILTKVRELNTIAFFLITHKLFEINIKYYTFIRAIG